jgi:predicted transcriptional regulator
MTIEEVSRVLDARVLCGADKLGRNLRLVYASDLMSDVLAFAQPSSLLITGLANLHVVLTAEMAEIAAVCFVRGKIPDDETVRLATEKGIPLLTTNHLMFGSSVLLHDSGMHGHPARTPEVRDETRRRE